MHGAAAPCHADWRPEILAAFLRCDRCNKKVVLALADLAARHGNGLPVWRAIDRLRCHRRLDGASCSGIPRCVVLAECDTYGKSIRITREIVVRDG